MHQEGSDRRKWPRIPAASLGHLSAAVVAGPDVKLVNLSRGGALIEVAARFPMRSSVRLKLMQPNGEVLVAPGRVAWAKVASIIDRQVNYTVAVIFDQLLPEGLLPTDAGPQEESEETVLLDSIFSGEQDASKPAAPARDNLTQFPSVAVRRTDSAPAPPAAATTPEPAPTSTVHEALTAQLAEAEQQRAALRAELDTTERRRQDERTTLEQEATAAVTKADALATRVVESEAQVAVVTAKLAEAEQQRAALRAELDTTERRWQDERTTLEQKAAAAVTNADALAARVEVSEAQVAAVTAQLAEAEQQRAAFDRELEAARRTWDEARAQLEEALTAAVMRADTVQAALTTQEQAQAQALADQQGRYEALTAELLASANDQQAEYQQLLDERTAERDALRGQVDAHAAELLHHHSDWEQQRAALETRVHELEARADAADALCAAHTARARALQLEAEKLMGLIAAPVEGASQQDATASADGTSRAKGQAVA